MRLGYDGNVPKNWHPIPQYEGLQRAISDRCTSVRGSNTSESGNKAVQDGGATHTPSAREVIERMHKFVGVSTDIELAQRLNLGRSAPSNWRSRNSIPFESCISLAAENGASLDWLLLGKGSARRADERHAAADDGFVVPVGHVALNRLEGFDVTSGPDRLIFPEVIIRQRVVHGDISSLRWMINPTDALAPRYPQGRLLVVDSTINNHADVVDGETYVVRMWGRVNVRRIFIIGQNEYRLRGDREHEERRDVTGKDYKHLEIGGRVVDAI